MWVEEESDSLDKINFKFTSKELDEETGLYYFGARYLDAKVSRWLSCDPALMDGTYLDSNAGLGGVFNPVNLSLYHYAGNNPLKYTDPDGKAFGEWNAFWNIFFRQPGPRMMKALVTGNDQLAVHAWKMAAFETGIQTGKKLGNIGSGMVYLGMTSGNPVIILVGTKIDIIGGVTQTSAFILKFRYTGDPNDFEEILKSGGKLLIGELAGKLGSNYVQNNPHMKKYFNKIIRILLTNAKKGRFKKIHKKAAGEVISKISGDAANIVIKEAYKILKKEKKE